MSGPRPALGRNARNPGRLARALVPLPRLGLRAAGVSTELLALAVLVVEGVTGHDKPRLAEGIAIAGAALYVAGTVDDIVTVPGSARRENQRRQNLMIAPMIRPDSAGVMLTGRF